MGKRFWTIWIKQTLVAFALVFLVGALLNEQMASDGGGAVTVGFWSVVFYVIASFVLLAINSAASGIYLWLFSGDDLVDTLVEDFRRVRLPAPGRRDPKTRDYLTNLADDENAQPCDRVHAALLFGGYNAVMARGLFRSLHMQKALDRAVLRYSQEAPVKDRD